MQPVEPPPTMTIWLSAIHSALCPAAGIGGSPSNWQMRCRVPSVHEIPYQDRVDRVETRTLVRQRPLSRVVMSVATLSRMPAMSAMPLGPRIQHGGEPPTKTVDICGVDGAQFVDTRWFLPTRS